MRASMTRRALAFAAGGGLFLGVGFLGAGAGMAQRAAAPEPGQIVIDNFAFSPAVLTVTAGTTVTWVNKDEEPHTVRSTDRQVTFRSPALDTNEKFSFVFDKPGSYKYFCTIHSHMIGTVIVQ